MVVERDNIGDVECATGDGSGFVKGDGFEATEIFQMDSTFDEDTVAGGLSNPGENSGEPRLHLQDEVIIIKEGQVEASCDGKTQTAGPGSVIFFAANATTRLRNAGSTPCTYIVVYYFTPLTPKS